MEAGIVTSKERVCAGAELSTTRRIRTSILAAANRYLLEKERRQLTFPFVGLCWQKAAKEAANQPFPAGLLMLDDSISRSVSHSVNIRTRLRTSAMAHRSGIGDENRLCDVAV